MITASQARTLMYDGEEPLILEFDIIFGIIRTRSIKGYNTCTVHTVSNAHINQVVEILEGLGYTTEVTSLGSGQYITISW